jgi:hypothetical protein
MSDVSIRVPSGRRCAPNKPGESKEPSSQTTKKLVPSSVAEGRDPRATMISGMVIVGVHHRRVDFVRG